MVLPAHRWNHGSLHITADPTAPFTFLFEIDERDDETSVGITDIRIQRRLATGFNTRYLHHNNDVIDDVDRSYEWLTLDQWQVLAIWFEDYEMLTIDPNADEDAEPLMPNDGNSYRFRFRFRTQGGEVSSWSSYLVIDPMITEMPQPVALNTGYIFFEGSRAADNEPDYIGWALQEDTAETAHPLALTDNPASLPDLSFLNTVGVGYFYWLDKTNPAANQPYNRIRRTPINEPSNHTTVATLPSGIFSFESIYIDSYLQQAVVVERTTDNMLEIVTYDTPTFTNRRIGARRTASSGTNIYEVCMTPTSSPQIRNGLLGRKTQNAYLIYRFTINYDNPPDTSVRISRSGAEARNLEERYVGGAWYAYWYQLTASEAQTRLMRERVGTTLNQYNSETLLTFDNTSGRNHIISIGSEYIYVSKGNAPDIVRYDMLGQNPVTYNTGGINVQDMQLYEPPGWNYGDGVIIVHSIVLDEELVVYRSTDGIFYQKYDLNTTRIQISDNPNDTNLRIRLNKFTLNTDTHIYQIDTQQSRIRSSNLLNLIAGFSWHSNSFGDYKQIVLGKGNIWGQKVFALEYGSGQFRLIHLDRHSLGTRTVLSRLNMQDTLFYEYLAVTENYAFISFVEVGNSQTIYKVDLNNPHQYFQELFTVNKTIGQMDTIGNDLYFAEIDSSSWTLKKIHDGDDYGHAVVLLQKTSSDSDWDDWRQKTVISASPWALYVSNGGISGLGGSKLFKIHPHGHEAPVNINPTASNNVYEAYAMWPSTWTHPDITLGTIPTPTWVTGPTSENIDNELELDWNFLPDESGATQTHYKLIRFLPDGTNLEYYNGASWASGEPLAVPSTTSQVSVNDYWDVPNTRKLYRVSTKSSTGKWSHYSPTVEILSLEREVSAVTVTDTETTFTVYVRSEESISANHITAITTNTDITGMSVRRRIDPDFDAASRGVSQNEIDEELQVTVKHPMGTNGIGHWFDRRCRSGIEYQYQVRLSRPQEVVVGVDDEPVTRFVIDIYTVWSPWVG